MEINQWFHKRGLKFIIRRGTKLLSRYGLTPSKAEKRIRESVDILATMDCKPTFFVPAFVMLRNLKFIRWLAAKGCEIGVHGYNHVDLLSYSPEEASRQLVRAIDAFHQNDFVVHGFRCPYLSSSNELIHALDSGIFDYSSNQAVKRPHIRPGNGHDVKVFTTIEKFYNPINSEQSLSLPWEQKGIIELPACVPDDLQLYDGLGYKHDQIAQVWHNMLYQTYQRGELFNLMFHPELAAFCEAPFQALLEAARAMNPKVWIARLHEVSEWWRERNIFSVEIDERQSGYTLRFKCTSRATLLFRGITLASESIPWADHYHRSLNHTIQVDGPRLPFIGLPGNAPDWVVTSLEQMGYILASGEDGLKCSLYLDRLCLSNFKNPVELINYIETLRVPMIRYWPWPDGMRSVLCLTGDLDALSLMDYAARLFVG